MNYCRFCMSTIEENAAVCPHCKKEQAGDVPMHHLLPGTLLQGKYLVGAALGEGGFGITYIGLNVKLDMKVAIKEYFPFGYVYRVGQQSSTVTDRTETADAEFFKKGRERFLSEAKTLAQFNNEEGIVSVYDFFEENNSAYIVMEYLEGETLKTHLQKKGRLSYEETLSLLLPAMKSLDKVHKRGLIHRDISPDNVMLTGERVKLLDFGAARDVSAGNKSLSVMLKHGYAPEEQYRRRGEQGPWTDVYALCATIYKCITGVTPDDANDRLAEDELKPPSAYGVQIDPLCEAALMKGMSVKAANRYQSAGALIEGLSGRDKTLVPLAAAVDADRTAFGNAARDPDKTVYGGASADPDKTVYGGTTGDSDLDKTTYGGSFPPVSPTGTTPPEGHGNGQKKKSKKVILLSVVAIILAAAIMLTIVLVPWHRREEPNAGEATGTTTEVNGERPSGDDTAQTDTSVETSSENPTEDSTEDQTSSDLSEPHTHLFSEWNTVKAPTCTEEGKKERTCECGEKESESIAPKGHSYGDWALTKAATDTENGIETKTCTVCGNKVTRTVDKIQHNYVKKITAPTCTAQGYTTYTCKDCGNSYVDDYTPAKGHAYGRPTFIWSGYSAAANVTCSMCGTTTTMTPTMTSSVTKEATCTATGTRTYVATITVDGKSYTDTKSETIYALGHNYVNGVCTRCGDGTTTSVKKGDIYTFGAYEQDNNLSNGKEAIEWIVLDVVDGKALLLSKYALDCQPYNTEEKSITWETCTLRTWLNETFYNTAFNSDEKEKIASATLENANNPRYGTNGGNYTTDKVFLLSLSEINNTDYGFSSSYSEYDIARRCRPTTYAKVQGCRTSTGSNYYGDCWWWLRSPGSYSYFAASVQYGGTVNSQGHEVRLSGGFSDISSAVRPALWIDLEFYERSISVKKGDIYTFGAYEQDNDTSNGKETIEWVVLDVVGRKALLLSKYALDCQPYNTENTDVTWETCTLRTWLNGIFYDTAFNSAEKERIASTTLENTIDSIYGSTIGGNNTTDKVFLLSSIDIKTTIYGFSSSGDDDTARRCQATAYAKAQGCWTSSYSRIYGDCRWWLRSTGMSTSDNTAAYVNGGGPLNITGFTVSNSDLGVRPALWINLEP